MIFRNSTDYPDHLIRRMLAWCIKEIGVPPSKAFRGTLRKAAFTRCARGYRGRAGGGAILVRIGEASRFPVNVAWRPCYRAEGMTEFMLDRDETLVHITAHELAHIRLGRVNQSTNNEMNADAIARAVTLEFQSKRAELWAAWSVPPAEKSFAPIPSIQEQRAAKAATMLAAWNRKLSLAKSKVRKYQHRVTYYERAAATRSG